MEFINKPTSGCFTLILYTIEFKRQHLSVLFLSILIQTEFMCFFLQGLQAEDYEMDPLPVNTMETWRYVPALQINWDVFSGFRSGEY